MTRRRVATLAAVVVLLIVLVAVGWLVGRGEDEPTAAPSPSPTPTEPAEDPCTTDEPFTPSSAVVDGIDAPVVAMPRDGNDVPGVLPLDGEGASAIAWDEPPGVSPGDPSGNVLLNAHTFPDDGALGNRFLDELEIGDPIELRGDDGQRLCYEVSERVEVLAADGFPRYYEDAGYPQIALIVCSGDRVGPGDWTHRTIWFAVPAEADLAS
ncbi:class F sortase [Aeromicrobium piscarium]|uniref:Class F sortase n=1 Tax=Aeromicrobium piscarium TaxID=2590901 RepID=A0A554SDK3_9ACTN|nr:class F sortase [Aeromicrobium piscarium]TSD64430.1 class F sortase [Aeromicrobium piscarium]